MIIKIIAGIVLMYLFVMYLFFKPAGKSDDITTQCYKNSIKDVENDARIEEEIFLWRAR